jgi:hypothetical protein
MRGILVKYQIYSVGISVFDGFGEYSEVNGRIDYDS